MVAPCAIAAPERCKAPENSYIPRFLRQEIPRRKEIMCMKKRIIEIAVKVVVAALTAFLTAITTTSCLGYGPIAM